MPGRSRSWRECLLFRSLRDPTHSCASSPSIELSPIWAPVVAVTEAQIIRTTTARANKEKCMIHSPRCVCDRPNDLRSPGTKPRMLNTGDVRRRRPSLCSILYLESECQEDSGRVTGHPEITANQYPRRSVAEVITSGLATVVST
jgi:hypothetical protein